MTDVIALIGTLATSIAIAYLLGAVPTAALISRYRGIDIFSVGTGLAGASNVRRHVGNASGGLVLSADLIKGCLAIITSQMLGLEGTWLVAPGFAVVMGHWNSVFTRFKGGDGLATLGGIFIASFMMYGLIAIFVGTLVALGAQKMRYTSLLSVIFGYGTLLILSFTYLDEIPLTIGLGVISGLVLLHASFGHYRRKNSKILNVIK